MENYEFPITIATIILTSIGLLWRFETRITGLSERVSHIEGLLQGLESRVTRIETVLDTYFLKASQREE
ncbi:MAG: hypothetical protein OXM03_13225 [Chloroflexota bacterium]|nr:hypothetical protein [Chloroflexota bacterium]MDE2841582.1 hypothetical protein [Chloroflexota bacterium]MDE2930543.1 hypothetical protein [Chloroflexota bacterium]